MGRADTVIKPLGGFGLRSGDTPVRRTFEIYVHRGFSELEFAAVTNTLAMANAVLSRDAFDWRVVSDTPGIVSGNTAMLVRAKPAVHDHMYADIMVVLGGPRAARSDWPRRARAMQRLAAPVVLLSDAATAFIRMTKSPAGKVTTHWRDIPVLHEEGHHPGLTDRLCENSDGILTAAGTGATVELIIGLIAPFLEAAQLAEIGNQLLLPTIRKTDAEQPCGAAGNEALFDERISDAIRLMEVNLSEPLSMSEVTEMVGISTRHMERVFREVFDETPARFYKRLRVKQARVMIETTLMPLMDVALATGFGSRSTMAKAVSDEYGLTPSRMRTRKKIDLLKFDAG
ncbi:GlxA family transcriptional regulator [Roseovarius pelagicus]|uniref:Helix-turn-helix domain-containing protein n=1 Tax=Roseovarius pelagicus TaxID=2980108 RepID=A0ABY6D854_9RHOB|nr:helix-turn-helix domain-containing protein [Roseovarius pelagicus]UXX82312.1 helix-turn-helix domain-containing protein [Roseovarius pelagicus]